MKAYVDNNLSQDNVIILGDLNDVITDPPQDNVFLDFINSKGIETRMILSGNFMNQPSIKLYNFKEKNISYNNAQEIESRGFFIGLHPKSISEEKLNYLEKNLLKIDKL